MSFNRISIKDAKDLLSKDDLILIDIRDYNSFKNGHIDNAIHVEDLNIQNFIKEKDKNDTILIYCYHGNSSQSAANFLVNMVSKMYLVWMRDMRLAKEN